jgi:O-antigen/teichoic acid export membrane protein
MSPRKRISSDLGKMLAGDLGGQILSVVRGLVVPLLVTPARYGLWRIMLLVWQYGVYLHLGSFALLNRELPGLLATGERGRLSKMRQTAFWGTMALSSLVAIGLVAFSLTPAAGSDPQQLWALRISAVGLVAQQIVLYVRVDLRAHSLFGRLSLLVFSRALAALLFVIPLAYVAGVPGLAGGFLLATTLAAAAFGRRAAFEPPWLDLRAFFRQAIKGIPLSSVPFLNTAISSVGQIVAASVLGLESAGFYGLGVMIGTVVYAVPRALGKVLYPRYLASYATANDPRRTGALLRSSLHVTTVASTVAVCGAAILLGPVYHYAFPRYLPALGATYALVAMMPFFAHALVLQNALLAFRLHSKVIALQVAFVTVCALLSLAGAIVFRDVTWVALGVMLANVGYGLAMLWLTLSTTSRGDRSPLREVLLELRPVVLMGALTIAMLVLWKPSEEPASRGLVPLGQLLALSPVAVFYGLRTWRAIRPAQR